MTPEEFYANEEVRRLIAFTYWRGRLHGNLKPGCVPVTAFENAAVDASTVSGDMEALYDSMLAELAAARARLTEVGEVA